LEELKMPAPESKRRPASYNVRRRPLGIAKLTAKPYSLEMVNQLRLSRAARIGMLLALFLLAYLAGKFSELPGNAEWWIFRISFLVSNAILGLLIFEAWKRDG
jgi:hypothetical protein